MNDEQDADRTSSRRLKRRWDEEDAARDELETKAKELFLEERANAIFAPIEECLTGLDNVLRRFNASRWRSTPPGSILTTKGAPQG
jgi:hypothetical protein